MKLVVSLALLLATPALGADAPYKFTYTMPPAVHAIPKLKAELDAQAAKGRRELVENAVAGQRDAKKDGRSFTSYDMSYEWSVVANTPRFLSLSLGYSEYMGGAHPNSNSGSTVWDRQAQVQREPVSFFVSVAALDRALGQSFCDRVNAERKERGIDVPAGPGGMWPRCPSIKDGVLLLGSKSRTKFDRLGVLFDQYAIASYADGPFEFTVPVTPAILAAVKPEFRSAFAVAR